MNLYVIHVVFAHCERLCQRSVLGLVHTSHFCHVESNKNYTYLVFGYIVQLASKHNLQYNLQIRCDTSATYESTVAFLPLTLN